MSRIGKMPIVIPAGVEVNVNDANTVTVKGPKGTLTQNVHKNITVSVEGSEILVTRPNDEKENRALQQKEPLKKALKNAFLTVADMFITAA